MAKHARTSVLTRAACSLAPVGGLSAVLVTALVAGATPALATTATPTSQQTSQQTGQQTNQQTSLLSTSSTPVVTTVPAAASSTPTTPAPTAPVLRMSVSAKVVGPGQVLTVGGRMYRATNSPGAGVLLDLVARQVGGGWARVAQARTASDGLAVFRVVPRTTTEYQVRSPADARSLAAQTTVNRVEVQPVLSLALSRTSAPVGSGTVVSGRIAPDYAGVPLRIERRVGTAWKPVTGLRSVHGGGFRWTVTPGSAGSYALRAVLPGTPKYRTAVSRTVTLTAVANAVPTQVLRRGDRGEAVRQLQLRLRAVKADVGVVDGIFGNDLQHAVTAFQKSQGLPRTGVYDATTRTRLASPRPVRLRYPSAGRSIEVDISQQVLYMSEGGVLKRIVDVSTGNDRLYTVDGVTERAYTPRGRFRVERKIDGVRVSRLGELYRPAYFHRGWAVHGSPSVPTYPASHGCVRVTNSAMDRLFGLMSIGVPVAVYD